MLERDEYIEQTHFFQVLSDRLKENVPLQDLLGHVREELLVTTKLPLAIDFLVGELKHMGELASAMRKLDHYFTPFQTYVVSEAEDERGRFDMRVAVEILRHEADYRARGATAQGLFMYQFEALCRNRMRYDPGLLAIAQDPQYDASWREWITIVRRQIGLVDFADLIYVRSAYFRQRSRSGAALDRPALFGEKEGKIAWANRRKDPLFLFAALQRHLGYPVVPRPKPVESHGQLVPLLMRRMERLETRLKLLEDEQTRGAVDLSQFYKPPRTEEGS